MENHISQQLLVFVQSILLGLAIGSLYDLLRPFRLRLPRVAPLLDGVYALAVGAGCFRFILARRGNCGDLWCWESWAAPCCFFPPSPPCCGRCGNFGRIPWAVWSAA